MPDESEDSLNVPDEADERMLHEVVMDALNEWLAGSGFITAFHIVADFVDADGDDAYMSAVADGQTHARTLGLLAWAQRIADYEAIEYLRAASEDD